MSKPTIFFSHSSKDKKSISYIRNKILKICSNTINIFQSSDGESIPFGNNWVHKIEENLNASKIMFVFVSPNSIKSNWLYFESGFTYSKNIKVIPIGLNGIDIGQVGPPINLLQGFNITSHEGLNNIITIINKEFNTTYEPSFDNEDFKKLNELSNNLFSILYNYHIDYISIMLGNITNSEFSSTAFQQIADYFEEAKIKHSAPSPKTFYLKGMLFEKYEYGIEVKVDELNLKESLEIINGIVTRIYTPPLKRFWFSIIFNDNIELLTSSFKLSSRLGLVGIEMSDNNAPFYDYKTIRFNLLSKENLNEDYLRIAYDIENFEYNDILELIDLLFENKLLKIIE